MQSESAQRKTLPSTDGRLRRSERSRQAITEAALELVREGVLIPTAQQIADRAKVGIRSVFRHYADMETLFDAMGAEWQQEAVSFLAEEPISAGLEERTLALVRRRAQLFSRFAPIQRSKLLLVWKSERLRSDQMRGQRALRNERARWIPELTEAPAALREAFDATTSFAHWNQLSEGQGLEEDAALAAIEAQTLAIVRAIPSPDAHD